MRDRELWGQPSYWAYRPPFHRCQGCGHRPFVIPPVKRKDTSYTPRFEQHILQPRIGGAEAKAARRLGLSAETVRLIVRKQRADAKAQEIDPQRGIADVGIDELSLKKRPKLYVRIRTDLTNRERPEAPAVAEGRDEAAARKCLEKLTEAPRPVGSARSGTGLAGTLGEEGRGLVYRLSRLYHARQ